MPRVHLTPGFVKTADCPPGKDRELYWDAELHGFGLLVTERGHQSWIVQYRNRAGESRRITIKGADDGDKLRRILSLDKARKEARGYIGEIVRGGDPLAARRSERNAGKTTLRAVVDEYFDREGKKLRSAKQWRPVLERCVLPKLGNRQIEDIANKRSLIVTLLDDIEDERGPGTAKVVRTILNVVFNWYAGRVDGFANPILRGLRSVKYEPRSRILSDDELTQVWKAAESFAGPWGRYIQFLLLTACRKSEAARMTWGELDGDVWIIAAERSKTKSEVALPLSAKAQAVLASLPRIADCPFVFTTTGRVPIGGFSQFKKEFDKASGTANWTLHDLRRTSRTLMARAGVDPDHAERALGHATGGVRGVYDRHRYGAEVLRAFEALSALLERIVHPKANVTTLTRAKP
jgi:integrase